MFSMFGVAALLAVTAHLAAPGEALDRSDIRVPNLRGGLNTQLILGNGDLMAFIEEDTNGDLIIGTSKNDVWDIRLDTSQDAPLLPVGEIERIARHGQDGKRPSEALKAMVGKHAGANDSYHRNPYPSPRMTGRWRIPLSEAGLHAADGSVSLRTATATVRFAEGGGLRCAIHARKNVLVLWPLGDTSVPRPELMPILARISHHSSTATPDLPMSTASHSVGLLDVPFRYACDGLGRAPCIHRHLRRFVTTSGEKSRLEPELIPEPSTGEGDDVEWLLQALPNDLDRKGIRFAVVARSADGWYALAQATSHESADPKKRAETLVAELPSDAETFLADHVAWWQEYWSRSSVELADPVLEGLWRQQVYFIGATIRAGEFSPGLFAPLTNNAPAWHGDYHTNYNIQQTYWSVLPTNHPDLMQPYEDLIVAYLPRAQWLSKELYGVSGAFYPHVIMFDEPQPGALQAKNQRQYVHIEWAYTLGVTAFTVQNLWWRYQYEPDPSRLKNAVYPVLSETADFYANVLEKYRGEDGTSRPPTVSPEHWGWTAGLERNRNCTFDTALIADNLKAAIAAEDILGGDAERSERWRKALELLPAYPTYRTPDGPIIIDIENAKPIRYNIPIPSTVVFPGEQLTFMSPKAERDIFTRTIARMESNGNNDMVINSVARARLDMPDAYDYVRREYLARRRDNGTLTLNRQDPPQRFNTFGHYTEMYGAATAVSELLLQSVGDVLRVFPGWPKGKAARFTTLRAKGGFLVSAAYDGEQIVELRIESTASGACCVASPWPRLQVNARTVEVDERGLARFPTEAGQEYTLTSGP